MLLISLIHLNNQVIVAILWDIQIRFKFLKQLLKPTNSIIVLCKRVKHQILKINKLLGKIRWHSY